MKSLKLIHCDFRDEAQYTEWLFNHSGDVPKYSEIYYFQTHVEGEIWIKVGNGVNTINDLRPIYITKKMG